MGAFLVIERHPFADDPLSVEAVGDFLEINRLLFQRPPKPLDEDIIEKAPAPIHGYFDAIRP